MGSDHPSRRSGNDREGPRSGAIRKLDNVLTMPHIGYVTEELYRTFYGDAAASIGAWLNANAPRTDV
jgi:phosphoglycerate dehydrogenase-like enzyme